jgi:hypothetical protein
MVNITNVSEELAISDPVKGGSKFLLNAYSERDNIMQSYSVYERNYQ